MIQLGLWIYLIPSEVARRLPVSIKIWTCAVTTRGHTNILYSLYMLTIFYFNLGKDNGHPCSLIYLQTG